MSPVNSSQSTTVGNQARIIVIESDETIEITCQSKLVTLRLPRGDQGTFVNLCGYAASLEQIHPNELPQNLPTGFQLTVSMKVLIANDGKWVNVLPRQSSETISFVVDPDESTNNYAILYWDHTLNENKGGWLELPLLPAVSNTRAYHQPLHPEDPSDQRMVIVPVYELGNSRIQASLNFTGIFVLVQKER
jgi:hypothetical protein